MAGGYTENDLLTAAPLSSGNGHTISGTASLQQQFGEHFNLQLGYTRLHQDYSGRRPGALPTPIANSFRFPISSPDRWEDNSMVDDLEEESSEGFDLQHWLGVVRRRHMQFLIPLLLGWALVWGASWVLPSRYQSSTLILVEQPTMPKDYVTPNVNDDLQDRLRASPSRFSAALVCCTSSIN